MLLAIDTATERASIALGVNGDGALEETIEGPRRHAAGLLPAIETLLRRAAVSLADVRGIVLSDGPGSFTGLRVGASVAKALVHARGLPLWVTPSLLVRAAGVAEGDELVLAVSDALRGEVYAAAYRIAGERVVTELAPSVYRPAELLSGPLRPARVVGEPPPELIPALENWAGSPVIRPPRGSPHAARMLDLVGWRDGAHRVDRVQQWEPTYGRPAEAQARWEKVHGRRLSDSVGSSH